MSHEAAVQHLVANEYSLARALAIKLEDESKRAYDIVRQHAAEIFPAEYMDECDEFRNGNTNLLEFALEEKDLFEVKRLCVAMEDFKKRILILAVGIVMFETVKALVKACVPNGTQFVVRATVSGLMNDDN